MAHNIFRAGILFPALLLLNLFPLFADETDEEDFYFVDDAGITITGTPQTSQQMAVIDKEEIQRCGAPDLASLLQQALTINIVRYGAYGSQTGVALRGLDSKRLVFLIDGVPVQSAMDGKFDINQIDLGLVERIEVIYGGSDTRYNVSGAMGGVINIVTIGRQRSGLRLGASVSNTSALPGEYRDRSEARQAPHWEDLLDTQNYSLSASYGGGGYSLSANVFANRAENHFIFTDSFNRTRRKDNNEVWDSGAAVSAVWNLGDLSRLITSANFYYGDKNIPTSGFSGIFGRQNDLSVRGNVLIDMPRIVRDDIAAEASLGWHFVRGDYTSPSDVFSRHDQQNITAINRWSWYPGEWLILRAGFDYRFVYMDSTDVGLRLRHDGGIYLTAEYKPVNQLLIIPSIKAVLSSGDEASIIPIPKLGLVWYAADSLTVKNNYFRSFKFPDFEELYWSGGSSSNDGGGVGNPNLKPEDGWGADIGIEWHITESVKLESVFFTHWLKDSIHWYSGGDIWRPENVGEAMFFGLENRLHFDIPVRWGPITKIIPSISYQYLLSYLLSFGYDFASDKRIPYSPEHTIGGSIEIFWLSGSVLISGHYESLRYHDRANITELKPHFLLDASVNQKAGNNLVIFGTLRNILNESYESFYGYPMPGCSLTLGIRVQYEAK